MGVGKIPKIKKEWTCQREPSDKMSFVLFFVFAGACVLFFFSCREAEMVSEEN